MSFSRTFTTSISSAAGASNRSATKVNSTDHKEIMFEGLFAAVSAKFAVMHSSTQSVLGVDFQAAVGAYKAAGAFVGCALHFVPLSGSKQRRTSFASWTRRQGKRLVTSS